MTEVTPPLENLVFSPFLILLFYDPPALPEGAYYIRGCAAWLFQQPRHIALQVLEVELPGFLREVRQGM